jgi:hypothetical protein
MNDRESHHIFIPIFIAEQGSFKDNLEKIKDNFPAHKKNFKIHVLIDKFSFDIMNNEKLFSVKYKDDLSKDLINLGDDRNKNFEKREVYRNNRGTFINPKSKLHVYEAVNMNFDIFVFTGTINGPFDIKVNGEKEQIVQPGYGMGVVEVSSFPSKNKNSEKYITLSAQGIGFKRWFGLEYAKHKKIKYITVIDQGVKNIVDRRDNITSTWSKVVERLQKTFDEETARGEQQIVLIGPQTGIKTYTYSIYSFYMIDTELCATTLFKSGRDIQYRAELQIMGEDGLFAHECNASNLCFRSMKVANFPRRKRGPMRCDKLNDKLKLHSLNTNNDKNQFDILPYFNLFAENYLKFKPFGTTYFKYYDNLICQPPGNVPLIYGDIHLMFKNVPHIYINNRSGPNDKEMHCSSKSMQYFPSVRFTEEKYQEFMESIYDFVITSKPKDCSVTSCSEWPCKWIQTKYENKKVDYYAFTTKKTCKDFGENFENPYFIRWFAIGVVYLFWSGLKIQQEIPSGIRVYHDNAYSDLINVINFWQKTIPYGDLFKLNLIEFCEENLKPLYKKLYTKKVTKKTVYLNPMWIYCINNSLQYKNEIENIQYVDKHYDSFDDSLKLSVMDFSKHNLNDSCVSNTLQAFMGKECLNINTVYESTEESFEKDLDINDTWYTGEIVSVDMTDIEGWENYDHAHLDGVIEFIIADEYAIVQMLYEDKTVAVDISRLNHDRDSEPLRKWKPGERVQVYEINEKVPAWWDAKIEKNVGNSKWKVQLIGDYEINDKFEVYDADNIRSAN